jgi:hypothetical protein
VAALSTLIDGFLKDTGALYPRPNPAYKPTVARVKPQNTDPLDGWKERQCKATLRDGVLSMKAIGKAGTAFLGHGTGTMKGPATVNLRVRSTSGGAGKIESFPKGSADPTGMVEAPFTVSAGDWQDLQIKVNNPGPLGTLRVYLPDAEIDWIEVVPAKGKAMRSDFAVKP